MFHYRHKPWLWSSCLCLRNLEVVPGSNITILLCVACYSIYQKLAWLLKVVVQEKADSLLS